MFKPTVALRELPLCWVPWIGHSLYIVYNVEHRRPYCMLQNCFYRIHSLSEAILLKYIPKSFNSQLQNKLTGLKTSIRHSRCTASWVACEERVYRAAMEGGLWPCRNMWALAPSHAVFMSSRLGVPSNSTIRSSWNRNYANAEEIRGVKINLFKFYKQFTVSNYVFS